MRAICVSICLCVTCSRPPQDVRRATRVAVVLKHQPLWGDAAPFHAFLDRFRRENPDLDLRTETLPNASDVAREMFLTALEGGADDFDVFAIDVVWAPEFARAGWLADLSEPFPAARLRKEFLPRAVEAVTLNGRVYAVPWFLDVGLLYYRTDLVPRAPRTYDELRDFARAAMQRDPRLAGFLWQGRQYEGLNCNAFEGIWGHGGEILKDGRIALETSEARAGLEWLRGTITSGLSPRSVLSSAEEETRRAFQDGRAVFLRNWPYVWAELQQPGSTVRGKVAFAPLPSTTGQAGAGTLGGWQLAVNARSSAPRRRAAEKLIAFLTSHEAAVELALHYSRIPARRAVYDDPRVKDGARFIAALLPIALAARPRPVTPYYELASDSIQGELSAAIVGLRPPAEALQRAQRIVDHLENPK
ncbi:MAG TPA: ABC transporter substrate-binding protein [Myxococcales bacterium]|nr:ABC transporter substrate-binding protein [Myxococcales bacterium]